MVASFTIQTENSGRILILHLEGSWTIRTLATLDRQIKENQLISAPQITINASALKDFDTSAAWYIKNLGRRLKSHGVQVNIAGLAPKHQRIYERVANLPDAPFPPRQTPGLAATMVIWLGELFFSLLRGIHMTITFVGQLGVHLIGSLFSLRHLRIRSIVYHLNEVGLKAVPIITLMAFSIAVVTGYQGAIQLERFGATIFTVDLIVLSTLREMGVLLSAIMLAGRSGSAFAAQIGTMKLNEEVDALQTMGVSPFEVLVMPRLIAIIIALPVLTFLADLAGIAGAYVFTSVFMDMSYLQFLSRFQASADFNHLCVGLYKAPVFALLIGMVGCMQGLQVKNSAEQVGRRTTAAVVQSIFLVIVCDALFSILFTKMGI